MNPEQVLTTNAEDEYRPDETWAEFSARVDSGLRPGGPAPDCIVLGPVDSWISDEARAEANRMFEFGRPPRPKRNPRLFRRFGRVASS